MVALVLKAFVAQAFSIPSPSMEPQLLVGDRVAVSRIAYRLHDPNRGDIIVFPAPGSAPDGSALPARLLEDVAEGIGVNEPDEEELIKRVIGLPGETIEGRDGHVVIDGRVLIEPYLQPTVTTSDFGPVTIPEGRVFVMGDNRGDSHDSRYSDIGTIDEDTIVGRAIGRIWPPHRRAFL